MCHRRANLQKVQLNHANLQFTDLRDAILTGAKITPEQLATVSFLENAIMPNGVSFSLTHSDMERAKC